jgi:hypothetical protein
MSDRQPAPRTYQLRTRPKDLSVLLVLAVALTLGYLLYRSVETRTTTFQADPAVADFRLAYPSRWIGSASLLDINLLKVEDPLAPSAFKTTLTVEQRPLDLADPPTLQTLLDRRVEQRQTLAAYHFLTNRDTTVSGERAVELEYAYVAQPIDQARRAALPVVVHAREVIFVTQDQSYYVTLAAPEQAFAQASRDFDRVLASIQAQ